MDSVSAVVSFSVAAWLLTMTPGPDTALVLRAATLNGPTKAMAAGVGVVVGVLAWGVVASLGLGGVLTISETGYRLLQYLGAAYLLWLGSQMVRSAYRRTGKVRENPGEHVQEPWMSQTAGWFWRGLATNLLNPKVGVFYFSFLPQFIPADAPIVSFSVGLASIHAVMGLIWFAGIVAATKPFSRMLSRSAFARAIDGMTGAVLITFGIKLLLERRN